MKVLQTIASFGSHDGGISTCTYDCFLQLKLKLIQLFFQEAFLGTASYDITNSLNLLITTPIVIENQA